MKTLTIAQAGTVLRMSYNQIQRRLMLGLLKGGQDAQGRWYVEAEDASRQAAERVGSTTQAA